MAMSGQFYIMFPASQNKDLEGHHGEGNGGGGGGGGGGRGGLIPATQTKFFFISEACYLLSNLKIE